MFRSILVPLDGSPWSEHALPVACSIARHSGAMLSLVHVHVPAVETYIDGIPIIDRELDARQRVTDDAYLATTRDRLSPVYDGPIVTTVLDGVVTTALREYIETSSADLLVLTTHGRGGFARLWLGSVADVLVREVAIPMLLIKPREAQVDVAQDVRIEHILIPLDGSALAEAALAPALDLGRLTGASLTLLQVVPPGITGIHIPRIHESAPDHAWTEQRRDDATRYLQQVADRLRASGAQVHSEVVTAARAAVPVLEYAKAHGIDLISMATHGRGGVQRLVLGSTADKVMRAAELPVLLYRAVAPVDRAQH